MADELIDVELHFAGPYRLLGAERSVFTAPEAARSGVYLWVVPSRSEPGWIHYVGETTNLFVTRCCEHLAEMSSGTYSIFDIERLRDGEPRCDLWEGHGWGKNSKEKVRQFREGWEALCEPLRSYIDSLEVMLGPMEVVGDCTKRVESALLSHLRSVGGTAADMVSEVRFKRYQPGDRRLRVRMSTARPLHGFPEQPLEA
mgnify:CR=1 FL=1